MKLYFTLFFSAAIVAILGGCNQQPAPATRHTPKYTVDIANKQYSEKAALQVVDAIKLQTTKKSLINQIAKIIKYGDYLFIVVRVRTLCGVYRCASLELVDYEVLYLFRLV